MKKSALIAIVGIVAAVIVVALLLYISSELRLLSPTASNGVKPGRISLSASALQDGLFTYSDSAQLVGYALVDYTARNFSAMNLSLNFYESNPVQKIYLLNVTDYCYKCISEGSVVSETQVYQSLEGYLMDYGLITNESSFQYINFSEIGSIGDNSIIIIPSGLMPITLMPSSQLQSNSSANLITLLNRRDTILYIGRNFSQSVGQLGTVYSTAGAINNTLIGAGIDTIPYAVTANPLGLYFDSPTFNFTNGQEYGQLAYVNADNGTIIALSNVESVGWKNTTDIASDLAKILYSRFWIRSLAYGNISSVGPEASYASNSIGILTTSLPFNSSGSDAAAFVNSTYPLARMEIYNSTGAFRAVSLPFRIGYEYNGSIGMPVLVGETQPFQASITISTTKREQIISELSIMSLQMNNVQDVPLSFFNITPSLNTVTKSISFSLPPGGYIAMLRASNGTYYSGAAFRIPKTNVTPTYANFKNATFNISVYSNGWPVTGVPYSISLNNGNNQTGILQNGQIVYTLPKGTVIPYGIVATNVSVLGAQYTYFQSYTQEVLNIPTMYIEFGIVIFVIIVVNLVVKAPNRDEYYIDVEGLPPTKKVKVRIKKDIMLDIFDKVNFYYRWKYMPLTPDEVKAGISQNIRYGSIPVAITLQNASFILNKMVSDGDLTNVEDYYMPATWTHLSGHSAEYLAIFRQIRDYCISNAILFTDLGISEQEDMVITKSGISANVIIYTADSGVRDMHIVENSRMFMVFLNDTARADFIERMHTSYGEQAEVLKMGIYYGYIKLVDVENLGEIVL